MSIVADRNGRDGASKATLAALDGLVGPYRLSDVVTHHKGAIDRSGRAVHGLTNIVQKHRANLTVRVLQLDRLATAYMALARSVDRVEHLMVAAQLRQRLAHGLADNVAPTDQPLAGLIYEFDAIVGTCKHRHEGGGLHKDFAQPPELSSLVLLGVASGKKGFSAKASGFASDGYGDHSPFHYGLGAVILVEIVLTAVFLYVIIGSTDVRAPAGFAGIAIGFTLTMIHLIAIPVSNTSVNPARSTGPAIIQHGWALGQLWVFWLAPLVGAAIAGASYHGIFGAKPPSPEEPLAATA